MRDFQRVLHSKRMSPTGQDAVWHRQVLAFLCAQISDIRFDGGQKGRLELSLQVSRHALKKRHVAERIRVQESLWVRQRSIPESGQGKNARVECLLEDRGTRSAMEQYISGTGKHANSEGLAQVVTDYWGSRACTTHSKRVVPPDGILLG